MPSVSRNAPPKVATRGASPRAAWLLRALLLGAGLGAAVLGLLLLLPYLAAPPVRSPAMPAAAASAPTRTGITTARAPSAAIENVACWFATPHGRAARCGILHVPEKREAAGASRQLGLRFAILSDGTPAGTDPIVYISGGPGEAAQLDANSIGFWWSWMEREPWLHNRDLVLFDQRGVGLSEPRMDCPELVDAAYKVLEQALTLEASDGIWAGAAGQCHARLAATGIDLANYNTASIVADLKDLLAQLGYRAPILLASSFGTRVALRLAADPAIGIGAMVLDSIDPPEAHDYIDSAANAAAAFAGVFQSCAGDAVCHAAFPGLAGDFDRSVARAAQVPLRVTVADPRGGSLVAQLDDGKLVETLFYAFYDGRQLEQLPAVIAAVAQGDTRPLAPLVRLGLDNYDGGGASLGLFLSVECHDDFAFNPRAEVERAAAAAPQFRKFALSNLPLAACPAWPVGHASETEHAPLRRDVPMLLLAGELDPATPPRWAEDVVARLPHAYLFKFPGIGHGVLGAQVCASRLVEGFLASPSRRPSDDCLLALAPPQFRKVANIEAK
jgi:pimeloyl-ACP methyl ester carboxylesterase